MPLEWQVPFVVELELGKAIVLLTLNNSQNPPASMASGTSVSAEEMLQPYLNSSLRRHMHGRLLVGEWRQLFLLEFLPTEFILPSSRCSQEEQTNPLVPRRPSACTPALPTNAGATGWILKDSTLPLHRPWE